MIPSWSLEDVTQIAEDAPYTFYLPSRTVVDQLAVGNAVKLMFNCAVENDKGWGAERMWVEITGCEGDRFTGVLDNEPYYIPDLKPGDPVTFDACHIMQTDLTDPVPSLSGQFQQRCIVTRLVMDDGHPVRVMYRDTREEMPDDPEFSGWNLFSGLEDESYCDDPDNLLYVSLGAVLNRGDHFLYLLDREPGASFVWDDELDQFVAEVES